MDTTHAVNDWLSEHPDAAVLVTEAGGVLARIFDAHLLRLELELVQDMDWCGTELFAWIVTDLDAAAALELLALFDGEWWLERIHGAGEKLNFSLRFV